MSKISVVIPSFNRRDLLKEAISPLLTVTPEEFECIVIDDASEDDTIEVLEAIRQPSDGNSISIYRQPSRMGAQIARNRGIELASGEYIMFMDSDDVPLPQGILRLRNHLSENPKLNYCYGSVQETNGDLISLGAARRVGSSFNEHSESIAGYHWHTMGALYRRSCIEKVGSWNAELTGSQDWEYQARVKLFGGAGEFLNTTVGYWRHHAGERVGAQKFRPDYVRSVMVACDSIITNSEAAGQRDPKLEERIAKKLIVHALEWGANGHKKERVSCLDQASNTLTESSLLRWFIGVFFKTPAILDPAISRLLARVSHH